ncbi:alpha/beta hydrolase [bacterium]|nr:alpha/beta hydrolase [bacterium]
MVIRDRLSLHNPLPNARRTQSSGPAPASDRVELGGTRLEGPPAWGWSMTGDIRYHEVKSEILGNSRQVWVYLPPGYAQNPDKDYPVLYAMDGQNVFEKGTAFGGNEWRMDEAAQRAMTQGTMKEAIIVAVSNAGAQRIEEYSPKADPQYGGGGAEKFAQFLKTELKPMIDGAYRTQTAPESTGVLGSSMGGLVSLYLGLAHSNTFGLVGALSPSLWFAEKDMIKSWAEHPPAQRPAKIWLDMGDRESQTDGDQNGIPDTLDNTRALRDVLASQGQPGLLYREIPGGTHTEGAWSERIQDVLQGLLPPA